MIAMICALGAYASAHADDVWRLDDPWMSAPGGSRTLVSHRYPEGTPLRALSERHLVVCTIYNSNANDHTIVICATREQHLQIVEFLVKTGRESPLK